MEFIKGKWYKTVGYIGKFHHLDGFKFYGTEWVKENSKYHSLPNKPTWDKVLDVIPIFIKDIAKYLPKGHPDLKQRTIIHKLKLNEF